MLGEDDAGPGAPRLRLEVRPRQLAEVEPAVGELEGVRLGVERELLGAPRQPGPDVRRGPFGGVWNWNVSVCLKLLCKM